MKSETNAPLRRPTNHFRAHKLAKIALRNGDYRLFASAARHSIPAIPGLGRSGSSVASAIAGWVEGQIGFDDAQNLVISELSSRTVPLDYVGVVSKWLLSAGMFTAALVLREAADRQIRSGWLSLSRRQKEQVLIVAVQNSDRASLERLANNFGARHAARSVLGLNAVARIAAGHQLDPVDREFAAIVDGRTVGVLGPAPLTDNERDQILACDLVAAPVAETSRRGEIIVPEGIDLAYADVAHTSGLRAVTWAGLPGIFINRSRKPSSTRFLRLGHQRSALLPPAIGRVGGATAIPDIVFDLLASGAKHIKIAGANFYITTRAPYRRDAMRLDVNEWNVSAKNSPFFATSMFATHPPIENRNFVRTLSMSNRCTFVGEIDAVMRVGDEAAAVLLEETWSRTRR